jgi:signal transduction histidine kinase
VLTYPELKRMLNSRGIDLLKEGESELDRPIASLGRMYPILGGSWRNAIIAGGVSEGETVIAGGWKRSIEILKAIASGRLSIRFAEILFCEECIAGPMMDNNLSMFERAGIIKQFASVSADPQQAQHDMFSFRDVTLNRRFHSDPIELPEPTEEEIRKILSDLDMSRPEDERNCGSCGYDTCRQKAIAAFQGLAEKEMCLPYLFEKLQSTQEVLIHMEKISSLGQMAAGVAHEINNPIQGVLTYIRLLLKNLKNGKFKEKLFEERLITIEQELDKCGRVVKGLLEFSRQTEPALRLINIAQVIERALQIVDHEARINDVRIIKKINTPIKEFFGDPDQLQQVFTNISLNAIQAMPLGGTLTVQTLLSEDKKELGIFFADTGSGISKENMKKLFTPFFTTKDKGKGVGLGLTISYGIVKRHEGRIEVKSELGKGSQFTVWLPLSRSK